MAEPPQGAENMDFEHPKKNQSNRVVTLTTLLL
jgi:hypothetical protein